MSKQDRCPPRNATDLERRYKFKASFREILGIAEDAQRAAEEANAEVAGLTAEQIFNILTDNGKEQGIYRKNGKIYINASYILTGELLASLLKTGVITSKDGSVEIDLSQNKVTVYAKDKKSWFEIGGGMIRCYKPDTEGNTICTLRIKPGAAGAPVEITNPEGEGGVWVYGQSENGASEFGAIVSDTRIHGRSTEIYGDQVLISGDEVDISGTTKIGNKTVSWKDNGDGTFTLIGS